VTVPAARSEVDRYISGIDRPLLPVARAARDLVRANAPLLTERLCMGVPTWFDRGRVLYLADYHDHVNLGFYQGVRVADPHRLLEGTGKSLRHVKIYTVAMARVPELAGLVQSAAALGGPEWKKRA
jgi:hypothetical protein